MSTVLLLAYWHFIVRAADIQGELTEVYRMVL